MTQFTTLKDLPAAKREFTSKGWTVKKAKETLNGRPAFWITEPSHLGGASQMVTDYGLLHWASNC